MNMTVYVRTINGKTISIKYDRQQKAATILETVERKTLITRDVMYLVNQGKMLNDKKTIEEHNIGTETTNEMFVRVLGGMEKRRIDEHNRGRRRKRK